MADIGTLDEEMDGQTEDEEGSDNEQASKSPRERPFECYHHRTKSGSIVGRGRDKKNGSELKTRGGEEKEKKKEAKMEKRINERLKDVGDWRKAKIIRRRSDSQCDNPCSLAKH